MPAFNSVRIRTVKPEFWTNPDLAKLDPFVRLLALALLNYADDEGYFWADPELMRASMFPYEQKSVRIQGGLTELSNIRYVTLHNGTNGRIYGKITTFEKHQRINRPTDSKIKEWINFNEDSLSNQGGLTLGTGNREQGKGTGNREGGEPPKKELPGKTALMRRTETLFKRREATPWSKAEEEAWKRAILAVETTTEEEWQSLERFYALPNPPPPAPQLYRRQNLDTLLNHWAAEIDKARANCGTNGSAGQFSEKEHFEKLMAKKAKYENEQRTA